MKVKQHGKLAEGLACLWLLCKGYHILARNVVTGRGTTAGEIDIIAQRGKIIIFAEVKKRQSLEKAAYAISKTQKNRIRRGAEAFLTKHPELEDCDLRFDAILIKLPWLIRHIKNAW